MSEQDNGMNCEICQHPLYGDLKLGVLVNDKHQVHVICAASEYSSLKSEVERLRKVVEKSKNILPFLRMFSGFELDRAEAELLTALSEWEKGK